MRTRPGQRVEVKPCYEHRLYLRVKQLERDAARGQQQDRGEGGDPREQTEEGGAQSEPCRVPPLLQVR